MNRFSNDRALPSSRMWIKQPLTGKESSQVSRMKAKEVAIETAGRGWDEQLWSAHAQIGIYTCLSRSERCNVAFRKCNLLNDLTSGKMTTKVVYFTVGGKPEQAEFASDFPADEIKGKLKFSVCLHGRFDCPLCGIVIKSFVLQGLFWYKAGFILAVV